jgi:putative salt-induced outer membrane protein YdiY
VANYLPLSTLLLAISLPALADRITLKNGDRLTGAIITSDDKSLTLKTEFAGEIKIDRAAITAIESDQALNVTLKDQGKVQAIVQSTPDSATLKKADGATLTVKPDTLAALRNDAAQRAWEREQERLLHPRFNDFWSGFVSLGIANASGNSKTTSVATAASAVRAAGRNKMALNFAQIYATQSTTQPFGATANRISGSFRIDRDVNHRLFAYGINAYDYDKFLDLDLRSVFGGGFGYHAWKSPKGYFDVSGGGNYNREKFSTPEGPLIRKSGEVAFGQEFGYQPFSKLKLFERLSVFPNLSETGEYRMNFDSTASIPVLKWLEWNLGFNSRYLSNPLAGKRKNDTILTMGIRVSFDQSKR